MRHSRVLIEKSTVTKTTAPALMRIEVEKTRKAFEIGGSCGLFRVPKIINYDETSGTAVFERLNIKSSITAAPWGNKRTILANNLGKSLAIIHREMSLSDEMRIPLPEDFPLSHDPVFIHGDLGLGNVFVGAAPGSSMVIIDWQMTPLYGGESTFGSRYFDIIWFVSNLIYRPSIRFIFGNPATPVIELFLESYFKEAKISYNQEEAVDYAVRIFELESSRMRKLIAQRPYGRTGILLPFGLRVSADVIDLLQNYEYI